MLNICKHIGRSFHDEGILYINWKKKDGLTQKEWKNKETNARYQQNLNRTKLSTRMWACMMESKNYISNEGSLKQVWSCQQWMQFPIFLHINVLINLAQFTDFWPLRSRMADLLLCTLKPLHWTGFRVVRIRFRTVGARIVTIWIILQKWWRDTCYSLVLMDIRQDSLNFYLKVR